MLTSALDHKAALILGLEEPTFCSLQRLIVSTETQAEVIKSIILQHEVTRVTTSYDIFYLSLKEIDFKILNTKKNIELETSVTLN